MSVQTNHVASDNGSELSRISFMVRTMLGQMRTAMPVKVTHVTNSGGVSSIGYVDVMPMVSMVDGQGGIWDHAEVYNVPYMRIQGGADAVIIDPKVGDIGIAVFCDRDISTVKNSKDVSAPGSNRKHDISDAVYLMSIISATPTQYIQFQDSTITIHSPGTVNVNAPAINLSNGGTLHKLVTDAMVTFFNSHTHPANGAVPSQTMGNGQLTSVVKGE